MKQTPAPIMRSLIPVLTLLPITAAADGGYLLGATLQADDADGFGFTAFADVSVAENTSISGAIGRTTTDVSQAADSESLYADLGIDHKFGAVGVRLTAAYWGDSDLLDSRDLRGRLYVSGERGSIGIDIEERDFEFQLPRIDTLAQTQFNFDASGIGLSGSLKLSDDVTLYASGRDYDYSVPFRIQDSDRIRPLLVISRLSILSTLADWRASGGISIDVGEQRWGLDYATWEGEILGSRNDSYTLTFLTPISTRVDMEIGIGQDTSEFFGDATIGSLRFFYYGGE